MDFVDGRIPPLLIPGSPALWESVRDLPGLVPNGKTVLNSHDAMILEPQPKRLIVIGAGAIGVEFAYFFNAFGTEVTIVEMLPNVLPVEDTEISVALEKSLAKQGIKIFTGTKLVKAEVVTRASALRSKERNRKDLKATACWSP